MGIAQRKPAIIIGTGALAALTGVVVWAVVSGEKPRAGDSPSLDAPAAQAAGMSARERGLADENEALRRKLADAEARAARTSLEVESSAEPVANVAPEKPTEVVARFADNKYGEALSGVDWGVVGSALKGMVPLSEQLTEALLAGETPLEAAGKFQEFNGQLVAQLQPLMDGEVPGTGPNGVFTHPLVVANQVDQVLAAGDVPLSEEQSDRLQAITDHYLAQDENLRISAEGYEFSLQTILEETAMKDHLRWEIEQILSAEQHRMLYPDSVKDYNGLDLFGTGLVWAQVAKPTKVEGPEDLARRNFMRFSEGLKLREDQQERLRPLLDNWARSYPAEYWTSTPNPLEGQGMLKTSRTRIAAERQLELFRAMLATMGLTAEQRDKLTQNNGVLVPLPK